MHWNNIRRIQLKQDNSHTPEFSRKQCKIQLKQDNSHALKFIYSYCTQVKLLKARRFNLNGFRFTDYLFLLSLPFVRSKVLGVQLQNHHNGWRFILTITKYVKLVYVHYHYLSIWEPCCICRSDLTPFYTTNALTVDLRNGEFLMFTWFN